MNISFEKEALKRFHKKFIQDDVQSFIGEEIEAVPIFGSHSKQSDLKGSFAFEEERDPLKNEQLQEVIKNTVHEEAMWGQ